MRISRINNNVHNVSDTIKSIFDCIKYLVWVQGEVCKKLNSSTKWKLNKTVTIRKLVALA